MAVATILRRAASSLLPLTGRAIRAQRTYHSSIFAPRNFTQEGYRRTFPSTLHFSSLSSNDQNLLGIIESEIKCAEESDDHNLVPEIPKGFPFKIQDEPGTQAISLERQYQGEVINVEVHMSEHVNDKDENEDEDDNKGEQDSNDNSESDAQSTISLVVSVSKGKNEPCMEFGCTAYPDEITIDSLIVKDPDTSEDDLAYEGPDFSDLDENLQKAFYKYLEDRGIKPSTTNFLYEYMYSKDNKEYAMWLKNLKYFVEK